VKWKRYVMFIQCVQVHLHTDGELTWGRFATPDIKPWEFRGKRGV
jgi:hypothetical protein